MSYRKLMASYESFDRACRPYLIPVIALLDLIINVLIINFVSYTEIDWIAYMQEVRGVANGQYNYSLLEGDTGPLVYPAGFVWIFNVLRLVTDDGHNVLLAQYFFAAFHTALVSVIGMIFHKVSQASTKKVPVVLYILLIASRRVHSIFCLRLFNDGVAMLVLYIAIFLFVHKYYNLGVLIFSFSCSIKMNIILFLPGIAVMLVKNTSFLESCFSGCIFILLQMVLGAPFLMFDASSYLSRAIDVNRVFMHKWTVNYKFLEIEMFQSKELAAFLTVCTLITWILFGQYKWATEDGGLFLLIRKNFFRKTVLDLNAIQIVEMLFTSNFIGVIFFRSLHYQFYVWYFHTLGFLLWRSELFLSTKLAILLGIEAAFNIYPSTTSSSMVLQVCHTVLFIGLCKTTFSKRKKFE